MLKFAFLLLLLLNSFQTSTASEKCSCKGYSDIVEFENYEMNTANYTMDEKIGIMKGTFVYMISLGDKIGEYGLDIKKYGEVLKTQVEKLRALDQIPLNSGWIQKSHVELCPELRALSQNKASDLSSYNITLLNQYNQFFEAITEISNFEVDMKKIKNVFYYISNKKRQMEVAQEVHELSERLRCLQFLKSMDDEEFFEKVTNLFEAHLYLEMSREDVRVAAFHKKIFYSVILVIVISGVVMFSKAFKRVWKSFSDEFYGIIDLIRNV